MRLVDSVVLEGWSPGLRGWLGSLRFLNGVTSRAFVVGGPLFAVVGADKQLQVGWGLIPPSRLLVVDLTRSSFSAALGGLR